MSIIFSFAESLNSIPDKSDVSIKDISASSLTLIVLSNLIVPVGCSFLIITSFIKSPSLSLS